MRRRKQTPIAEVIALGQALAETHPWVDVDELDHNEEFSRLVELLTDRDSIDDETFAEVALRGAKFLRARGIGRDRRRPAAAAGMDGDCRDPFRPCRVG